MTTFGTGPFCVEFTRLMQGDSFRAKPVIVEEEDVCEGCGGELDTDNPDLNRCTECLAAQAESRRESREER
jgi:hypothetical protein